MKLSTGLKLSNPSVKHLSHPLMNDPTLFGGRHEGS